MNWLRKGWGAILGYQSLGCWLQGSFLWVSRIGDFMGYNSLVLAEGVVFTCTQWLILTIMALVPFLVISCNMVRNVIWPNVALSVSRVPSLGVAEVMLSECRSAEMISILFGCSGRVSSCTCLCGESGVIFGSVQLKGFCWDYGRSVYFCLGIGSAYPYCSI